MKGGKKGGGGKGGKEAWKGYGAKGYTFIPSAGQWRAAAGSPGVPLPGPRQWAHPLQPGGGKGFAWCQEQPAGYMLSMCREVEQKPVAVKTETGGQQIAAFHDRFPKKDFTTVNRFTLLQEDFPELEPPDAPTTTTTTDATSRRHIRPHLQTTRNVQPKASGAETAAQTGIPGAQCTNRDSWYAQTIRRDWRRARKTSLATFLSSGQCASGCCGRVPTTDTLDTLDRRLPTTDTPDLRPSGATMLSAFTEKPKQSLRPLHSNSGDEWEVIDAILDSGASVTVIPPHMAAGHPVQESAASRAGVQYEVANGEEIPNLGEKLFAVVTEEGSVRGMRPQVADVSKALQSVRALVKTGHLVVFGDGADGNEHYILNRESGEVNAVRDDGLNYLMRLYVIPPSAQQPFAGQAEAR